ncbi:MAG: glycosyltransferase [Pyrinomonadaceae bacterium]
MNYLRIVFLGAAISICALPAMSANGSHLQVPSLTPAVAHDSPKQAAFKDAVRKLWEDHITWTRLFIVSAIADLPDKAATTERLLQNQVDIGNAIKPYYGNEAGDKLTALLKEHITTAAELVAAAKASDNAKVEDSTNRWQKNADEIATFLSGANPKNWPAAEMKAMMREHLDLTTTEAVSHLKKDWKSDIAAYDKVHVQILHMADMLSSGIIGQFPAKFS